MIKQNSINQIVLNKALLLKIINSQSLHRAFPQLKNFLVRYNSATKDQKIKQQRKRGCRTCGGVTTGKDEAEILKQVQNFVRKMTPEQRSKIITTLKLPTDAKLVVYEREAGSNKLKRKVL